MELEMLMSREPKMHTSLPWRIRTFRTSLSPNEDLRALRCVGKSMTGRDWTAYVESADGSTVLQTDGATEEEAIANAEIVLRTVNHHDALIKAIEAEAARRAYAAGLGVSEWEAFLWPEAITALSAAQE